MTNINHTNALPGADSIEFAATNPGGDMLFVNERGDGLFLAAATIEILLRRDPGITLADLLTRKNPVAGFTISSKNLAEIRRKVPLAQICVFRLVNILAGDTAPAVIVRGLDGNSVAFSSLFLQSHTLQELRKKWSVKSLLCDTDAPTWVVPEPAILASAAEAVLNSCPPNSPFHYVFRQPANARVPLLRHRAGHTPFGCPSRPGYFPELEFLAPKPTYSPAEWRFLFHAFVDGTIDQLRQESFSAKEALLELCHQHPTGISTCLTGGPQPAVYVALSAYESTEKNNEEVARTTWGRVALAHTVPITADELRYDAWWELSWLASAHRRRVTQARCEQNPALIERQSA